MAEGDVERAAREAAAAHALGPFDPMSNIDRSFVMANAGYAETAVEWAEYGVNNEAMVPDWYRDRLAWAYYNAGRAEDAGQDAGNESEAQQDPFHSAGIEHGKSPGTPYPESTPVPKPGQSSPVGTHIVIAPGWAHDGTRMEALP